MILCLDKVSIYSILYVYGSKRFNLYKDVFKFKKSFIRIIIKHMVSVVIVIRVKCRTKNKPITVSRLLFHPHMLCLFIHHHVMSQTTQQIHAINILCTDFASYWSHLHIYRVLYRLATV